MDPSSLHAFPSLVSEPRFATYLDHCAGRKDLASRLYVWNAEATAAFWGPISVVEVVVRNAIHDSMRSGRRDDWWHDPEVRLMDREKKMFEGVASTLRRKGAPSPIAGQVVASTSFGLWVGLTDAGQPRHPYLSYETALWQTRIVSAFPYLGAKRRKQLHRELDDLRKFRNRLAHHEPIFRAPLIQIRNSLIEVAGYVHPEAADLIAGSHRIDHVLARRRTALHDGDGRF